MREFPSSDTPRSLEEWEQLRDLAVGRMQRPGESAEARLRWARTALTAVAAKARCGDQQRVAAESVAIRAYLIKELGEDRSDPDRNLGSLCSDVLADLEISLDTAERLATVTFNSVLDPMGRVLEQHITASGLDVQRRGYTYRADGHLVGVDDQLSGESRRFGLDYREEWYETSDGDPILFQDHWFGHREPGEEGYQGPHIHVRPYENTRNGQIPGCEEHYYYDPSLG